LSQTLPVPRRRSASGRESETHFATQAALEWTQILTGNETLVLAPPRAEQDPTGHVPKALARCPTQK